MRPQGHGVVRRAAALQAARPAEGGRRSDRWQHFTTAHWVFTSSPPCLLFQLAAFKAKRAALQSGKQAAVHGSTEPPGQVRFFYTMRSTAWPVPCQLTAALTCICMHVMMYTDTGAGCERVRRRQPWQWCRAADAALPSTASAQPPSHICDQ